MDLIIEKLNYNAVLFCCWPLQQVRRSEYIMVRILDFESLLSGKRRVQRS